MAVTITLKKSAVANKRPLASSLVTGELALNSNSLSTGIFLLDDGNNVVKVGPTAVGPSAPNIAPVGSAGNSVGETWYDTGTATFCLWDGFFWRTTAQPVPEAIPTVVGTIYGCTKTGSNGAVALGLNALFSGQPGGTVAIGNSALCSITSGSNNTAVGTCSLQTATTANNNTALGFCTLLGLTIGGCNTALGAASLERATTANLNVGVGACTLNCVTTASSNTAIGYSALSVVTGGYNTALGVNSGISTTTGICNLTLGSNTCVAIAAGSCQLAIGWSATNNWLTGLSTKAIQPGAGIVDCAGFCGTAGQVLMSAGNAICWSALAGTAPISISTGTNPTVSITAASTTACGAVQLYNNTNSTSTALALTAAQGKNLQDQINALGVTSNLTLAGTFNAATGLLLTVTAGGTAAGFAVGSNIPTAVAGNLDYFVIVTTGGTYNPPGGGGPYIATQGDWFLSTGTAWSFLNVGADTVYATTTIPGSVCLSTDALAQAGTNTLTALTPATGASAYVFKSCYTAKGAIVTASGASAPVTLTVGADNQVLIACAASTNGLCWGPTPQIAATSTALGAVYGRPSTATSTSVGYFALNSLTTGTFNTAFGTCALQLVTTQQYNTAFGALAGCGVTGSRSSFFGARAGLNAGGGSSNVGMGDRAMENYSGSSSVALGSGAMRCGPATGGFNVAIGDGALARPSTGTQNIAIGVLAMGSSTVDVTGIYNTVVGNRSAIPISTGSRNTVVGQCTLVSLTTGSGNTALGQCVLSVNQTGNNNTVVGSCAGTSVTGSCNVLIGACAGSFAGFTVTTESNRVQITSGTVAGTARYNDTFTSWSSLSDARFKKCVQDLPQGLAFVKELRPVTFQWKDAETSSDAPDKVYSGFIAQEILEVEEKNDARHLGIVFDSDPEQLGVGTTAIIPLLVNAIKELSAEVEALKARLPEA